MLITIPDALTADELTQARSALNAAEWIDGKVTAGYQAQSVKENLQLPEGHPVAVWGEDAIHQCLPWSSQAPGAG